MRSGAEYWQLLHGSLPFVDVGSMVLQKGEVCHFCNRAKWLEHRRQTSSVDLGSLGMSFQIAPGISYQTPRVRLPHMRYEVLTPIENGFLYLTNKRVIFAGDNRNATLKLSALLGFTEYADGIMLQKTSSRNPLYLLRERTKIAALILGRLLSPEQRQPSAESF